MLWIAGLLSLWFLVACTAASAPVPPPPIGTCTALAILPHPPPPNRRSVAILVAWANTAAMVANKAIEERDLCRGSYDRLNAWAHSISVH